MPAREIPSLVIAAEICEDLWVPCPPSIGHVLAGATVIANCSASDEVVGKDSYRRSLIGGQSARLICGYVYANAGEGESTQDLVFGGHNLIGENGTLLAESRRFAPEVIYAIGFGASGCRAAQDNDSSCSVSGGLPDCGVFSEYRRYGEKAGGEASAAN